MQPSIKPLITSPHFLNTENVSVLLLILSCTYLVFGKHKALGRTSEDNIATYARKTLFLMNPWQLS